MKKLLLLFTIGCITLSCQQENKSEKPKLVVGIVVDQMRHEYIYRFYDKFSDSGFKRIIDAGYHFKNAHYNYIPTKTGPGHASIYTGTTPSRHGIIGNDWYVRELKRNMNCVEDTTVACVGGAPESGLVSPVNLRTTTITDELRLFHNFKSKVVGVSVKNRGASLPAGHNPTGAYWLDLATGNMITSTHYMREVPQWVTDFNASGRTTELINQDWDFFREKSLYTESIADSNRYEAEPYKGLGTTFPYDLRKAEGDPWMLKYSPYGNTLVREFAQLAVQSEGLGQDSIPDFLTVSFSATDDIGHRFGPRSKEVQDMYFRLDYELSQLLSFLDEQVGPDAYTLFLTADHGATDVPSYLVKNKMPGGYHRTSILRQTLDEELSKKYGAGKWIAKIINEQVYFDHTLLRDRKVDAWELQTLAANVLTKEDYIEEAFPAFQVAKRNFTDPFLIRLQNGYHTNRSGDVLYVLANGQLIDGYGRKGTDHRTGYTYDTHIPILFYGNSIKAGSSVRNVAITDIAPTVSVLLGISLPSSCTGQPLSEILE